MEPAAFVFSVIFARSCCLCTLPNFKASVSTVALLPGIVAGIAGPSLNSALEEGATCATKDCSPPPSSTGSSRAIPSLHLHHSRASTTKFAMIQYEFFIGTPPSSSTEHVTCHMQPSKIAYFQWPHCLSAVPKCSIHSCCRNILWTFGTSKLAYRPSMS